MCSLVTSRSQWSSYRCVLSYKCVLWLLQMCSLVASRSQWSLSYSVMMMWHSVYDDVTYRSQWSLSRKSSWPRPSTGPSSTKWCVPMCSYVCICVPMYAYDYDVAYTKKWSVPSKTRCSLCVPYDMAPFMSRKWTGLWRSPWRSRCRERERERERKTESERESLIRKQCPWRV